MPEANHKAIARRFLAAIPRGGSALADDLITPAARDAVIRALAAFAEVQLAIEHLLAERDIELTDERGGSR